MSDATYDIDLQNAVQGLQGRNMDDRAAINRMFSHPSQPVIPRARYPDCRLEWAGNSLKIGQDLRSAYGSQYGIQPANPPLYLSMVSSLRHFTLLSHSVNPPRSVLSTRTEQGLLCTLIYRRKVPTTAYNGTLHVLPRPRLRPHDYHASHRSD